MARVIKGRVRVASAAAAVSSLAVLLAACGGSSSGGSGASSSSGTGGGSSAKSLSFLAINENTTIPTTLTSLSQKECAAENKAQPLQIKKQAQGTLDQQLQLLAGQKALPQLFISANSPDLTKQLFDSGAILDTGEAATSAGVSDDVLPAASSSIKALYDGKQIVLPTELNIEGIWYNKKLLADKGISVPTTWDELTAAFAKLKAAGVQPISNAGKGGDGWGITRWVGNYILRDQGADALKAVKDGSAKLTDAKYVADAQAIADLGKKGYFGKSPTSIDYATALNTFMTGKAGFIYMGSWALAAFNDPKQNAIGADNIGFMSFPTVSGGSGTADQTPANVGTALAVSKTAYDKDPATQAWVKCIIANYGTVALRDSSQITGFKVASGVTVPPLSQDIQTKISNIKDSVLWFEAYFPTKATTSSQNNGGLLGSGKLSGEQFMKTVSADLG
ncbi:raffinose/stachyose/melibiose transport system substrate-binding protein [Motilibacter peucedani]|uniref:Raffinose/stachyose/melibiose transport system substrate-binding protein n=1 Tax=Motilibacter peucedani TaxID=598650 RepID=A0A420XQG0_9ACTN|nr:extracellular solute-binding protein [Motilibacter peucedani]RKS75474.1 raffinose/stachyose/melibiose transport system substrate-binding protein [Motilibacter peucedani]